jgi:hypothetical protein
MENFFQNFPLKCHVGNYEETKAIRYLEKYLVQEKFKSSIPVELEMHFKNAFNAL